MTVFNIRPAQCELLFPVVSVLPMSSLGPWDTAISVTNPAYDGRNGGRRSDVHLLWANGQHGEYSRPYNLQLHRMVQGLGFRLTELSQPGSTYQVMASEILGLH